jgi:hypothetical protein
MIEIRKIITTGEMVLVTPLWLWPLGGFCLDHGRALPLL